MKTFTLNYDSGKTMHLKLSAFFATLCCLFFSFSSSAQDCNNLNCTSNDVRVIRAYISGPNNAPINCDGGTSAFDGAELHLIISSNTQRIGVSISGLLIPDGDNTKSVSFGRCFKGEKLNNGSNNNLVYVLGDALAGLTCESKIELKNVFTSWGTGNTDFCTSTNPQCPATPAKCRYAPDETIIVDIRLAVDFNWEVGNCSSNSTSRSVDFTSEIIDLGTDIDAGTITYAWDFGDGGSSSDPNPSHPFEPGTYSVKLTVNAKTNGGTSITPKSVTRIVVIETCCNLNAPTVSNQTFCSSEGKKLSDLNPIADGGYFSWFDGADPETSFEVDAEAIIPVGTHTYWISYAKDGCESGRTEVTVTVVATPNAGTNGTLTVCTGTTLTEAMLFTQLGGSPDAVGTWTPALAGAGTYTYTVAATSPCTVDATAQVTVSVDQTSAAQVSLTGSTNACTGTNSGTINVTSRIGTILRWEISTDGVIYSLYEAAGTSETLSFTNLLVSTWFRVVVQSGVCPEANSNAIKITVGPCATTFTQGFWGGTTGNGKDCNQKTVQEILTGFNLSSTPEVVGSTITGKYLRLNDATKTRAIMPGGSYSQNVFDKKYILVGAVSPEVSLADSKFVDSKSGRLVSVVISQTVALALNIRYNAALGEISFQPGKNILNTALITYNNGCFISSVSSSTGAFTMSPKVLCYLQSANNYTFDIKGLLKLANNIIGGEAGFSNVAKGSPFSFSELVQTLDAINKGFDKGAVLVSYSGSYPCASASITSTINSRRELLESASVTTLTVSASPNPFTDRIRFTIQAPKAGRATLEVYNMLGQKVGVPFEGHLNAGETRNVEYTAPANHRSNLIYMLRMNGEQISGKLMSTRQ
ncbi:MAG TPA: PKD domain-containing protein [Flavisolibacter sp.]|nr:PKD domain-containing protein [Flavisolibacter sp.]